MSKRPRKSYPYGTEYPWPKSSPGTPPTGPAGPARNHGSDVLDRAQVLREGDSAILMFNQALSAECITSMREYLTENFPGVKWTFAENCSGAIIYRGNSGDT